jgi:hypothetical protein
MPQSWPPGSGARSKGTAVCAPPTFVATVPWIEYDTASTVVGEPYSASVGTKVCAPASVFSRMSGVCMDRHAGPGELERVAVLDDRRDLLGAAVEVEAQRPLS